MYIHEDGTVFLGVGETFLNEHQDKENINRIMVLELANGQRVEITRHFSQIRPNVVSANGWDLNIELDPESGVLLSRGPLDWGYGWNMKRKQNSTTLQYEAELLASSARCNSTDASTAIEESRAKRAAQS